MGSTLYLGNLKSLGRPGERSLLGEPVIKHPEGGRSGLADS